MLSVFGQMTSVMRHARLVKAPTFKKPKKPFMSKGGGKGGGAKYNKHVKAIAFWALCLLNLVFCINTFYLLIRLIVINDNFI